MNEPRAQNVFSVPLRDESDITTARFRTQALCQDLGFDSRRLDALALAVSEVARNVIVHAQAGELLAGTLHDGDVLGVFVITKDHGPGIPNLADAMTDGFST